MQKKRMYKTGTTRLSELCHFHNAMYVSNRGRKHYAVMAASLIEAPCILQPWNCVVKHKIGSKETQSCSFYPTSDAN